MTTAAKKKSARTAMATSPRPSRGRRRAPRRRRRSRRSPTTRSCRTATPARWSRPDGSIDWLCVPRFDAPERVRHAARPRGRACSGSAPFGINVPSGRYYEPGTNVLVTTWKTPQGWVEVRDALTIGPTTDEDTITPHTRPPADEDAEHMLVRTVTCLDGHVEIELVCEPAFDYGRTPGRVDARRRQPAHGRRDRRRADDPAADRSRRSGIEVSSRARPAHASGRRAGVRRAVVGRGPRRRRPTVEDAQPAARRDGPVLAPLAGPGAPDPRPPLARGDPALGADDQGPDLHADRGDRGGADHLAAGDARRRAQLGLPLHLDARHHVHPAGAAPAWTWTGRPTSSCSSSPTSSPTSDGGLQIMYGIDGRRDLTEIAPRGPVRLRGRPAGADRQRRLRPAPERRLRRGARLDPASTPVRSQRLPRRLWPIVQAQAECATQSVAGARPGHLGGPRQAAALRVLEADVLGGDGPRRQAGRDPRRPRAARQTWAATAEEIKADILEHGLTDDGRAAPALRHRRAGRLDAAGGDLRVPARRRRAAARQRAGDRRRPDRERLRAALPDRRDRRRPVRARRARS